MMGSGNIALNSYKQSLISKNAFQEATGSKVDTVSAFVSIFGFEVRQTLQHKSELCHNISSEIAASNPNEKVDNLCDGVNGHVAELQDTLLWAQDAGQEILSLPGLSTNAIAKAAESMSETLNFGQQVMYNTVNAANDAITTLKSKRGEYTGINTGASQNKNDPVSKAQNKIEGTLQQSRQNLNNPYAEAYMNIQEKEDFYKDPKVNENIETEKPIISESANDEVSDIKITNIPDINIENQDTKGNFTERITSRIN